ncbi:MAG: fumarylacetoacetate hydrolase family protein [Betaproteobacteria bacterium]
MLTAEQIRAASELLWNAWQRGHTLDALPSAQRPATRAEGYAIQALLERRSGEPLFGWKIAATSTAGQTHIGVDGPIAGRLLAERAVHDNGILPFGANHMRVVEAEFAFRMAHDLPPLATPYTVEQVLAAVGTLHPAIEVPDSRYQNFPKVGAPQLIADNACAHQFVLGTAAAAPWRSYDLVEHAVVGTVGGSVRHEGKGANVLGDPRVALTWLANELSRLGITLRAGQTVTTGTCLVPIPVSPRDRVVADFGALGTVTLNFGP